MDDLKTLVLTPWMAPHTLASWQQAIVLVYTKKVDVLEEYDAVVRSPSVSLQVPAVARLRMMLSQAKTSVKFSRSNIYQRDNYRCCYCLPKVSRKAPKDLTYDHVLPRSKGGRTVWGNIVTACRPCNARKDDRTPQQAGMKMHFKPFKPDSLKFSPMIIDLSKVHELWKPYIVSAPQFDAVG